MTRNFLTSLAMIAISAAFIPNALAAQNTGNNWPSRSCGCSSAGKCYIQQKNDGNSNCLPDGSGGNACTGVCSFTNIPADPAGGVIMRPKASAGGSGGVLQQ